jgi:Domain of unknown function (DUF4167)
MKRQRSRNRGGGGGGKPQHNANRAFESNGPDGVKIRGAAQHVFEKYQQLARDALTAGDRVLGESYQQHAEHYFRVLRAVQPQRTPSDIIGRDAISSGFDIDFEDETAGEAQEGQPETAEADGDRGEWRQESRYEGRRDDRQRNNGGNNGYRDDRASGGYQGDRPQRDDRNGYQGDRQQRDDRPRDDRNGYQGDRQQRDDRPRDDRNGYQGDRQQRDDRPRDDRGAYQGDRQQRDDRPKDRDDRPRDDRPREQRNDRNERYRDDRQRNERAADPLAVVEPQAAPLPAPADQPGSPILRSQDGGISQAPAFLQARAEPWTSEPPADAEARPRARRRRAPRASEGEGGDPSASQADATEDA